MVDLETRKAKRRESVRQSKRRFDAKKKAARATGGYASICAVCGDTFQAAKRGILVCGEGQCAKAAGRSRLRPFTVAHFKRWARGVVLDTEQPWRVEAFQAAFLEDVFAGVPQTWLLIPEGNTKTTTLAGLALYHAQFKRGGRVPIAASSRDQAFEMYLQAQGMVERSESLRPVFTCHEGLRQIKCDSMASRIQVFASDDRTGDGVIFTLALVDELHRHRDLRLYRTWAGKLDKRTGQVAAISTAGETGSEFEEVRARIRQEASDRLEKPGYVRAAGETVVLHEYAVPPDADTEDLSLVKQANPFSGVTIGSLRRKRQSPTMTLAHWRRFNCNVSTRDENAAVNEGEWLRQKADIEIPVGLPVWAGLDVAWKYDTTALVPMWMYSDSDLHWDLFPIHTRRALEAIYGRMPLPGEFRLLGAASVLEPPRDGSSLDPDLVEDALLRLHQRNPIATLVMDTSRAEQLSVWAERTLGCAVVDRQQTNKFAVMDYERWMEGLRSRSLWHTGCPELTRHVMNATIRLLPDGGARFDRPRAGRQVTGELARRRVIDALTAASMVHATAVAALGEEDEPPYRVAGFR